MRYTHYSFDLWLTLIKSQLDKNGKNVFKTQRAEYIRRLTDEKHSLGHVYETIRKVELGTDKWNAVSGGNVHPTQMYAQVLSQLGYEDFDMTLLSQIYTDLEAIFLSGENMPKLYSEDTIRYLNRIRDSGVTMSILSNTGFILGSTLRKVLIRLGLHEYFDYMLFSDEIGMSKPNPLAFDEILARYPETLTHREVCHVGDSLSADYDGAIKAGFNAFLVNSNSLTLKDVV